MMRLARKLTLVLHVVTSVGLIGSVLTFLVLAVAGWSGGADVYQATDLVAGFVVLPLAIAALGIGIVQSLISPWGLFRHYWVLVKLIATALVLVVLLLQLPGIAWLSSLPSAELSAPTATATRMSLVLHSAGGMLPLFLAVILSVLKPKGLTRYGWEQQRRS